MIRAWHHFLCGGEAFPRDEVVELLVGAGLDVCPLDLDAPEGRGVIFFDEVNGRTCDLLREVSRNGIERVLAIAVSRSALATCNAPLGGWA